MQRKKNTKQTWRIINNIINRKNCKVENTVKKIIQDDIVDEVSEDIANMFNDWIGFRADRTLGRKNGVVILIEIGNPMRNIFTVDLNFLIIDWQMEAADGVTHENQVQANAFLQFAQEQYLQQYIEEPM